MPLTQGPMRMDLAFFVRGIVAGLIIGMPVGPVGILGLRRMLFEGRLAGLVSGLGAACGDALFGAIAGFGLTAISDWLLGYQEWLRFAAACFLLYIGGSALLQEPQIRLGAHHEAEGLLRNYLSALGLTIANPVTILAFIGIFASLGLTGHHATIGRVGVIIFGVWLGSLSWWLMLNLGASLFSSSFTPRFLLRINRGSAGILLLSGAGLLAMVVIRHVV
jgi:threonine/homoserine/homoserine lactone efflux protein